MAFALACVLANAPVIAAENTTSAAAEFADSAPVADDATLDQQRGGFTNAQGLMVAVGIDRVVSLNGEVMARTRLDVPDLGHMNAEQARQTSAALSSLKLVQNGGETIYRPGMQGAADGGIIVQNSLNNQLIRTDTLITATVNSAALLNSLNFNATLQDALAHAAGAR